MKFIPPNSFRVAPLPSHDNTRASLSRTSLGALTRYGRHGGKHAAMRGDYRAWRDFLSAEKAAKDESSAGLDAGGGGAVRASAKPAAGAVFGCAMMVERLGELTGELAGVVLRVFSIMKKPCLRSRQLFSAVMDMVIEGLIFKA